jgi:hypothetical protein
MLVLAHAADEIIVTLDEQSMAQTVTMTADTLALLAPIDSDGDGELTQGDLDARRDAIRVGVWDQAKLQPCTRSNESATLEPGFVALRARYSCPPEGELTQEFRWLMVLPPTYRVIFGNQIAKGDARTLHVGRGAPKAAPGISGATIFWGLAGGVVATLVGFWLVRRWRR